MEWGLGGERKEEWHDGFSTIERRLEGIDRGVLRTALSMNRSPEGCRVEAIPD